MAFAAVLRLAPDLTTGPRPTVPGTARRIFGFSWPLFLLDVAGRLQAKSDEIVVGVVLSLGAVTPYALGRKLAAIPRLLAEQFAMVLLPRASELDATAERARLRSLYLGGVRVSLGLAMPLTVSLVLLAGPILDVWVGPGYEDGAPIVGILAIAAIIDLSLWPAGFVLQGIAHHRWLGPISMASGIANLVLSIALAPAFGIIGVAIGTLIPTIVEAVVVLTPYTLRTLDLGPRRFLGEALAPAVVPIVPAAIAIWAVDASSRRELRSRPWSGRGRGACRVPGDLPALPAGRPRTPARARAHRRTARAVTTTGKAGSWTSSSRSRSSSAATPATNAVAARTLP